MIVFGVCAASEARFRSGAGPGIERLLGDGAVLLRSDAPRGLCRAYNRFLDEAAQMTNLDFVVLMHDDTAIRDARLIPKLRAIFADEAIAIAGAVGARGVTSLQWWRGERHGTLTHRGGVYDWGDDVRDVEAVDGLFMALSPWAAQQVRFDERTCPGFHGYDIDYCFQVRSAGRRVVAGGLDLYHATAGGFGDRTDFERTNIRWKVKWGFETAKWAPWRIAFMPAILAKKRWRERIGNALRRWGLRHDPPAGGGLVDGR
jgi:hypothetical protein